MKRVSILAVGACLGAFLLTTPAPRVGAQGPAPDRPGGEFAGKMVGINVRTAGGTQGSLLQNVTTRRLGGREFLVGEGVAPGDSPLAADWKGIVIWVPVDGIESILVFDDKDKALRVMAASAAASLPKVEEKK